MVLISLATKGETIISGTEIVERGYEAFEYKLRKVGVIIDKFEENTSDNC